MIPSIYINNLRHCARASIKEIIIRQFPALSWSQQQWIEARKGYQMLIKVKIPKSQSQSHGNNDKCPQGFRLAHSSKGHLDTWASQNSLPSPVMLFAVRG
jgi:hypothetical protein